MTGFSRVEVVTKKLIRPSKSAREFIFPHRARMHLVVPGSVDHRRAKCPSMSAVGAASGLRASGGRNGVRLRKRRALALLQAGAVVGRESSPLLLPFRLGRRFLRPGQVRSLTQRIPVEPRGLVLAERGDAKSRELHGTLVVATLTRLLGADLLVLGGYPAAARITRASILAIAAQIV